MEYLAFAHNVGATSVKSLDLVDMRQMAPECLLLIFSKAEASTLPYPVGRRRGLLGQKAILTNPMSGSDL